MQNQKIIYVQQSNLTPVILDRIREFDPTYDWKLISKVVTATSARNFYTRAGKNSLPFCYDKNFIQTSSMPAVDYSFNKTFEEITDQRCLQLIQDHGDRPWIIHWSGGIDSTVILSSILKNLSDQQIKNITVACNHISIFENPRFFYKHILPNFKIDNSTSLNIEDKLKSHYIIDGNPADLLQGSGLGLHAKNSGIDLTKNWQTMSGTLMDFLIDRLGQLEANWLCYHMSENILSLSSENPTIDTLSDWFWWLNFNWKWMSDCWIMLESQRISDATEYFVGVKNWYDADDYQQWSIKSGRYSLITDGPESGNYKKASKQYIYDYDGNEYYYKFKTKSHSNSQRSQKKSWFCLLNDLTTLSAEKDLDLILELLPQHLNVK
jgi:hypothetical protein